MLVAPPTTVAYQPSDGGQCSQRGSFLWGLLLGILVVGIFSIALGQAAPSFWTTAWSWTPPGMAAEYIGAWTKVHSSTITWLLFPEVGKIRSVHGLTD